MLALQEGLRCVDLNEVAVFAKVVECESFSEAARQLGLPKSTVSRRISALEDSLGIRLLQRTTRSLHLTDAGHSYYQQISSALSVLQEAAENVQELDILPRGKVRITAPADLGSSGLAEVMAKFVDKYPEIDVEAILTNRYVDLVGEGVDLAIRAGKLKDSSLIARKITAKTGFILVASPEYLKRAGTPQSPEELKEHSCVIFRRENTWCIDGAERRAVVEVSGSISADDYGFVRGAARGGAGIACIPAPTVFFDLAVGRLVRILPDWGGIESHLHLVYPSARHLSRRVIVLRDFLVEHLAAYLSLGGCPKPCTEKHPLDEAAE